MKHPTLLFAAALAALAGCGRSPAPAPQPREANAAATVDARAAPPAGPAVQPSPEPGVPACGAAEEPIFECRAGAKQVAVCARGTEVRYRYGSPGHVELASPAHSAGLAFARAAFSGGGEAQVHFSSGRYRYVVYSRVVRTGFGAGGNVPDAEAGVAVLEGDRLISDRRCTAPADAAVDEARASRLLPEAPLADLSARPS